MKNFLLIAAVAALYVVSTGCGDKITSLEISFDYAKQAGPGSNQYAVWVEDASGQVVKTLFVTRFSALGRSYDESKPQRGYTYRPSCVHKWVEDVNADSLTDEQMDAFTGATPAEGGIQTFSWDFTDQAGASVPFGSYTVFIEADLHDWTIKTFSCPVKYARSMAPAVLAFDEDYAEPDSRYESMVTNVKFELK